MKKTANLKTDRVEETHRGLAGVGELRRVLNQVLTEVANGSRKLPIVVYQSVDMTVYQIHYQGAWLTVQVTEKAEHPLTAHCSLLTAHHSPLQAHCSPLKQKGGAQ